MSKKMYVGNLAFSVTESHLSDYFAQFGKVASVQLITDRATGRSKGFGFVEMATDEEAQTAIQKTNGQDWEGRKLTVNEARPKEDFKPGGRPHFSNGNGGGHAPRPRHFEPREQREESSYHNYSSSESHADLPPAEIPHFGKNAGHRHRDRDREKERDKMRSGRGR